MDTFIAEATGERRKIMISQRDYLLRAYSEGRLEYAKVSAKKFLVRSG